MMLLRSATRTLRTVVAGTRSYATPSIVASNVQVSEVPASERREKPADDTLVFGAEFSDHMMYVDYNEAKGGWQDPVITKLANFSLHPATSVFHYGMECFEGMKAYRDTEDRVRLFRPELNMARFNRSSKRMALPEIDEAELLKLIEKVVVLDKDWIPRQDGYSLYIRPTHIATTPWLGVGPSPHSRVFVILSPVGPYYKTGFAPVKLFADYNNTRAAPGGVGWTKAGGNYAPTILPQIEAAKQGCQQVLWLQGERRAMAEVGTMNLFVHWTNEQGEEELITPSLEDGTVLPGVTRASVIELAKGWGINVTEGEITMDQFAAASREGRLKEAFGAGTAVIISPVSGVVYEGEELNVPLGEGNIGPLAGKLTKTIMDIQYGRVEHEFSKVIYDPNA